MSDKAHSEVIELNFTEVVSSCLTPSTVITHSANMAIKYFNRYYWPLFDRMDQKGVAFEPHKWSVSIFDKKTLFPRDRNLLFVVKAYTAKNQTILKFNTEIFDAVAPFDLIAQCSIETKQAKIEADWLGEYEDFNKSIRADVADLTDELKDETQLVDTTKRLAELDKKGTWIGPAESRHFCLPDYCEFVGLGAMAKVAGVITSTGKLSLIQWAQQNDQYCPQLAELKKKTDYLNWHLWADRVNTFWQYDQIVVNSYYMVVDDRVYLKHITHLNEPKILTNTFIEEYFLN